MYAVWCIVIVIINMLLGTSTRVTAPADGRNQSVPLTCMSWAGLSSYPFTLVINDDMLFSKFNYILFSKTIGYVNGDEEGSTVMPVLSVLVTCEVNSVLCSVTRITGIRHVEEWNRTGSYHGRHTSDIAIICPGIHKITIHLVIWNRVLYNSHVFHWFQCGLPQHVLFVLAAMWCSGRGPDTRAATHHSLCYVSDIMPG